MNDLISKQALKEDLLKRGFFPAIVKCALEAAPVVDAVEVVRCRECKHYNKQHESKDIKCCTINAEYDEDVGVWYGIIAHTTPNFFCADEERKENERI